MYKSDQHEKFEEPKQSLHSQCYDREQGSSWRHGEGNPTGRRIATSKMTGGQVTIGSP